MDMSPFNLDQDAPSRTGTGLTAPLATEEDFQLYGRYPGRIPRLGAEDSDSYAYFNAATCPDCSGAMIRQGRCCVCPSCGFESCLV